MNDLVEIKVHDLGRRCWRWAWVSRREALLAFPAPPGHSMCSDR